MKITVITVNYNNSAGLLKTIDSVRLQSCQDFEFIIIDGASTDDSVAIIKQNEDILAHWISEPDNGVYQAMNKGIDWAKGEYCIFMNSGDIFYDSKVIEYVLPLLKEYDVLTGATWLSFGRLVQAPNDVPMRFLFNQTLCHQSSFIKTSLLKKYKYDENLRFVSDWKFWIQIFVMGDLASYKRIDRIVSEYDWNGMSTTNYKESDKEKSKVLESFFPKKVLEDYNKFITGETWEDKLYIEMKMSNYHHFFYTINVFIIKFLSLFKKGAFWIKKYPNSID